MNMGCACIFHILISSGNVSQLSLHRSFTTLVKLHLKYFFFYFACYVRIVFVISFSDCLHRNETSSSVLTLYSAILINSVQFSHSIMSDSLQRHGLQQARPPCLSPTPGVYSNSCPLSQGCHPTSHPLRISCKMLSWMKHKLESRLPGEMLSNLRYVDDTILTAESEED